MRLPRAPSYVFVALFGAGYNAVVCRSCGVQRSVLGSQQRFVSAVGYTPPRA